MAKEKSKYIEIKPGEGVGEYSRSKDGDKIFYYNRELNFKVVEFACHDGSDLIKIDSDLVLFLQDIRDQFSAPVNIHSAYRTKEYNKEIGGASRSQHIYGKAADIDVMGVAPLNVAQFAEVDTVLGIGLYVWGCHIDTRKTKYYWKYIAGKEIPVNTFIQSDKPPVAVPILRRGSKGLQTMYLQQDLIYLGYALTADGIFGSMTESALQRFQMDSNIKPDGIYGDQSRAKMRERIENT